MAYTFTMEFVETRAFTKWLKEYLTDDEYRRLQAFLANSPEAGDLIPATGGLRKLRWSQQKRGKGKRGGVRVIYCLFPEDLQIYLMTLYDKEEANDLTPDQKRFLRNALDQEKRERKTARGRNRR
jgi:mRNA-degrading endonuclease RelE of RelBE toxin-antitoxin system